MDGWMGGWMDGRTDGRTDGRMDVNHATADKRTHALLTEIALNR